MRKVAQYMKPYAAAMFFGFLIKFLGTIMDLALPWILSHLIDNVAPTGNRVAIVLWGLVMGLCAVLALAGNVIANRRASAVARDITRSLRHDLFKKTEHLSTRQIDMITVPSLIARLTTDTYNINTCIARMQRLGVRAPILLLGGITVTLMLDFRLSLVLLATLPLLATAIFIISKQGIPLFTRVQEAIDIMIRTVRDDLAGIRIIRALSKGEDEVARFHADSVELSNRQTKANAVMAATNPVMNLLLNGGLTAVVVTGAYLIASGKTETGRIIAFLTYFTIILNAMLSINKMFVMLSKMTASAARVEDLFNLPEDDPVIPLPSIETDDHIVFDDVSFSYNGVKNDISHLSFGIKKGSVLGIIGPTGSGKTTVIRLLQRFYPVNEGRIYINGEALPSIPNTRLHSLFGVAFQSDAFFIGTVRDNITLGRDIPEEDVLKAARCAQAMEFIEKLPQGLDTPVHAKANNLSGGQRQRLLIARALAGNPEILILDDSASALDYQTDANMRSAVTKHYPATTLVLISQRVSSVRNADSILVLNEGQTVGFGDHETLMATCPLYGSIAAIQAGETEGGDVCR